MFDKRLSPPLPRLKGRYQPGVTDPIWPLEAPTGVDVQLYNDFYAGQIERQRHLHLVKADIVASSRAGLRETLLKLSKFAQHQMKKEPPKPARPLDPVVQSRRVTVTMGFGATLFTTPEGDDRFGIAGLRPSNLKIIPQIDGDVNFLPSVAATDLIFLLQSDDIYVNEYLLGLLNYQTPEIRIRAVEHGYARPDSREPSGFEDGVTNPRGGSRKSQLDQFVYVQESDEEPAWCYGGTYLAYRKIRRRLAGFFAFDTARREAVFGVRTQTGKRLVNSESNAHSPKMNPRREGHRDLLGVSDDERQILRRPFFFDEGLDAEGHELRGVHHLSFARNLVKQYEWPVLMWQTNPDFPVPGAGIDMLYGSGGAANVSAGYYFIPPAAAANSCIGAALVQ